MRLSGEVELDGLAGELEVGVGEGLELVLDGVGVLGVEGDEGEGLLAGTVADVFAGDLGRVDEVGEQAGLDGLEGARARTGLGRALLLRRLDAAVGVEEDVLV